MNALTPLAVSHADVLRHLADNPGDDHLAIAKATGRIASNVKRDILKLAAEQLVIADGDGFAVTGVCNDVLRALARAEGAEPAAAGAAPEGYAALIWMQIDPDPLNPRKHFDEAAIDELAESIARDGLLENLVVRPGVVPAEPFLILGGQPAPMHRLVAGERRHRAIGKLIANGKWPQDAPILCKVLDVDDAGHRRLALVENLQRKDLRPIDEATALKELMAVTGQGTAEVAAEIGFTQRFVQQRLQLLELPTMLQSKLNAGELSIERGREAAAIWNKLPPIKQVEVRDGKITVEQAKAWVEARPMPLDLTPEEALILLEVGWQVAAKSNGWWTTIPCDWRVSGLPRKMEKADLLDFSSSYNSAQLQVRLSSKAYAYLISLSGADGALSRTSLEPFVKAARLKAQPGANPLAADYDSVAPHKTVDALFKAKKSITPWLNPPFADDPELAKEIAEREAQRSETSAAHEASRTAEQETRAARKAKVEALIERALKRARTPGAVEEDPQVVTEITSIFAEAGAPLPWRMAKTQWDDLTAIDAEGDDVELSMAVGGFYDAQDVLLPLIVAAINAAGGFPFAEGVIENEDEAEEEDDAAGEDQELEGAEADQ